MRIVSGLYRGRKLLVPKGQDIRPTSDKIRGAMFNMLQSRDAVVDAYVLDGFCGTGALGLEALSRGASHCTFFDKSKDSLYLAKDNANNLGAGEVSDFIIKDTAKLPQRDSVAQRFDLVFLDPPYNKGMVSETLTRLMAGNWLSDRAWIVCESEKSTVFSIPESLIQEDEKTYGQIKVTFLRNNAAI